MYTETATDTTPMVQFGQLEPSRSADPKAVLKELFSLLEDYGPTWYTEDHRNRALAAIADSN